MSNWNIYEAELLLWVQNHLRTEFLDQLMPYVSMVNNAGILAIITVLALLIWKQYRIVGLTAGASLLSEAVLVNGLIKNIVARERPYIVDERLLMLGSVPVDYSFPSGHTGSAFAVATVILLCMPRRYGIIAVVLSAFIAYSRVYNAVHYPMDVLGGMVIGIFTGVLASKLIFTELLKRK